MKFIKISGIKKIKILIVKTEISNFAIFEIYKFNEFTTQEFKFLFQESYKKLELTRFEFFFIFGNPF